jgi:LacI family transcriptional regulator
MPIIEHDFMNSPFHSHPEGSGFVTTIYDIAKQAGVSVTTVSKALNGYPDVSLKTRENVQRITKELGYHPAPKSIGSRRSMTIGMFFQDGIHQCFRNPFFNEVISSFKDAVSEAGYELLLFSNLRAHEWPQNFVTRAKHREVEGLFLLGVPRTERGLESLARSELPVVSIDLDLSGIRASYLCSDNVGGAHNAVQYLVEHGHRRIAFIGDQYGTKPGDDRLLGYRQALQEYALEYRQEWVIKGDFTEMSGYRGMAKLLAAKERPTAVFCASDMMAIGAMRVLSELGLRVPEDISMIGFDDIELARYVTPGLTTIRQNTEQMGKMAATELLGLMNTEKPPSVLSVETCLVERQSVRNMRR